MTSDHHKGPNHVAIIPDGNRRWAKQRGMKPWDGHRAGVSHFESIVETAAAEDIYSLSIWICSKDNILRRPREEVIFLFAVFETFFTRLLESPKLAQEQIRVNMIGDWRETEPRSIVSLCEKLQNSTAKHEKRVLNFFNAYDGISDMTRAIQHIAELNAKQPGTVITPELIKQHLMTRDLPPVDLVIRTGGEPHWSGGFLMWDIADAQFYFTDMLWPDFDAAAFRAAVTNYRGRERRRGA